MRREFADNKNVEATTSAPLSKTMDIRTITSTPESVSQNNTGVKNEMNLEVSDAIEVPDIHEDASLQLPLTSKKMIPQMKPIVKSQMQEALEKAGLNDWQRAKPIVHGMREQGLVDSKGNVMYELNLDAESAARVSDNNVASPTLNSTSNTLTLAQNDSVVKNDFKFAASAAETQQEGTEVKSESMKMDTDGEYYRDVAYTDENEQKFSKGFNRAWAKLKKRVYENGGK